MLLGVLFSSLSGQEESNPEHILSATIDTRDIDSPYLQITPLFSFEKLLVSQFWLVD